MKKIFTWFLREDLHLKDRWWHRLFMVCCTFWLILMVLFLVNSDDFVFFDSPQWKMVDTIGNRIDSELKTVGSLIALGEKIDEIDASSHSLNSNVSIFDGDLRHNTYCSSHIVNHIDKIVAERGVQRFQGLSPDVPLGNFKEYIKNEGIRCIVIDSYPIASGISYIPFSERESENQKRYFLRSDKSLFFGEELASDWGVYVESPVKTVLAIVVNILIVLAIALLMLYLTLIFYYKV
ncbi:MAG TPA: hypothetical protein PKD79_03790, partial [Candidatus Doudnabacteria bacterium]|nr:hypothetical protein [Candidatus Doudnabacteria bacterium]